MTVISGGSHPLDERDDIERRWLAASGSARASEHHFPADCLAEAVEVLKLRNAEVERLTSELAEARRERDEFARQARGWRREAELRRIDFVAEKKRADEAERRVA